MSSPGLCLRCEWRLFLRQAALKRRLRPSIRRAASTQTRTRPTNEDTLDAIDSTLLRDDQLTLESPFRARSKPKVRDRSQSLLEDILKRSHEAKPATQDARPVSKAKPLDLPIIRPSRPSIPRTVARKNPHKARVQNVVLEAPLKPAQGSKVNYSKESSLSQDNDELADSVVVTCLERSIAESMNEDGWAQRDRRLFDTNPSEGEQAKDDVPSTRRTITTFDEVPEQTGESSKYSEIAKRLYHTYKFHVKSESNVLASWREYQTYLRDRSQDETEVSPTSLASDKTLMALFLAMFNEIKRQDCVLEAWRAMHEFRIDPDLRHWSLLMVNASKERDGDSLSTLWHAMLRTGIHPDNQAYTIYIGGLLRCKEINSLEPTLQTLFASWRPPSPTKNKKKQISVTDRTKHQPSIIPINAAIAGLLKLNFLDKARNLMKWTEKHIMPVGTNTYNILLRYALRRNAMSPVPSDLTSSSILTEMKSKNLEPDIITFTIMLDDLVKSWASDSTSSSSSIDEDLTPTTSQQSELNAIFNTMSLAGLKAGARTYTTIINTLLKSPSPNLSCVRMILTRMSSQGIRPSPHYHTMLVTYYFSTSPPNIHAIDAIWRRVITQRLETDHVFFDRLIEGYARAGEFEKMLSILRKMPGARKTPGWIALTEVFVCLEENGQAGVLGELLGDLYSEDGVLRNGGRGYRGEERFMRCVERIRGDGDGVVWTEELERGWRRVHASVLSKREEVE